MSSKSKKKWNFGKLFVSNGAGCSGCSKPNSVDIIEPNQKPKSKIPIHTNQSPSICHTSSSFGEINDNDLDEDDHTSITFSINIDSLSPSSSNQNDYTNLSPSETNSESKVSMFPEIRGGIVVVRNSNDQFQVNYTSTPVSTDIDSLSPPIFNQNNDTNLSQSEANSESKVSLCPKIHGVVIVENLDDPFQDNQTSNTFSTYIDSLSPLGFDQNDDISLRPSEANSEFRASSCPKIHGSVAVVKDSTDPFQDFKKSMLQMIFEMEIYSPEDLKELLNCFLHLNSPSYREIIIQAFLDIYAN
ncbi:transcription repressor OFP4-like [Nicotiana tomentosiformis]|uniref:transcription repressor OFP4-like n=1 Tax=Nicotiana tomentosiformis TaxID=4098 RepID=UPI00051AEEDA|nr:transcription repressor OFP4-like [Nicotiana tomentosiformis]